MAEDQTARTEPCHPAGKRTAPAPPLLAVEFCERLHRFLLQLRLAGSDGLQQRPGDGIAGSVQVVDPLLHHVHVAQFAQAAEEAFAGFLHVLPVGIGIDGSNAVSHGTTASEGHPQVVHGVGCEAKAGAVAFFEDALHPESEARFLFSGLCRQGHKGWSIRLKTARYSMTCCLSPLRGWVISRSIPGACAPGCNLAPLRGWFAGLRRLQISLNESPLPPKWT